MRLERIPEAHSQRTMNAISKQLAINMEKSAKNGESQTVGGEREAMPIFHENFCGHIRKHGVGRSGQKGRSQGGSTQL